MPTVRPGCSSRKSLHRSLGVFAAVETTQRGSVQDLRHREPRVRLGRQACRSDRFFEAAGGKMCIGEADIGQLYQGVEGAEAKRTVGLLDCDRVVALPGAHDRTETERECRRTGERERSVECGERGFIITPANGDDKSRGGKRRRVVTAGGDRLARWRYSPSRRRPIPPMP